MAERDLETRVQTLTGQVRLLLGLTVFALLAAIGALALALRPRPAVKPPGTLALTGPEGSVTLDGKGLFLRDAKGVLRAELSLAAAGTHLVLGDSSGRAAVQLTAASDQDAPLSVVLIGRGDQAHLELKASRTAELSLGGSADEPTRVKLGYDDTRTALELTSSDGKNEARLSAAPGVNEALRLHSGEAQQSATVTLAPGGSAGLEVQDHASGNGAFLAPARLKLGGMPKEKVLTP